MTTNNYAGWIGENIGAESFRTRTPLAVIGFKIKILGVLSVVDVRRVRLPPSILPKIIILKPIAEESAEYGANDDPLPHGRPIPAEQASGFLTPET